MINIIEYIKKYKFKVGISILFSALFLSLFIKISSQNFEILITQKLNPKYIFFGVISLTIGYILRIARWFYLIKCCNKEVNFCKCIAPYLGSIALNNLLPFRLGDIVRAVIFPKFIDINVKVASASVLIERIMDVLTLLLAFSLFIYVFDLKLIKDNFQILLSILIGLFNFAFIFLFIFNNDLSKFINNYFNRNFIKSRTIKFLIQIYNYIFQFEKYFLILIAYFITILIWACEAGMFYMILLAFEIECNYNQAMLIMLTATLSTLIPSTPGYFGSYHLAVINIMMLINLSPVLAGSFSIFVHIVLWLWTTLIGILSILISPSMFSLNNLISSSKEKDS